MNEQNIIAFANIINAMGVIALIIGHAFVSVGRKEDGFKVAAIGSIIVAGGSILLESYPVVLLNTIWFGISVYGYYNIDQANDKIQTNGSSGLIAIILGLVLLLLASFSIFNQDEKSKDIAAYIVVAIYVSTYYFMAKGIIRRLDYLFWTFGAFFLLVPHLLIKNQYSVLFNESIGAIVSLIGLIKYIRKSERED